MPPVHNISAPASRRLVKEPVYFQLCGLLRDVIRAGGYAAGSQFLTEREVAGNFSVSRVTANKALSHLVLEGALEFRKGVGTFVKGGGLDYDLQSLASFTRRAEKAGKKASTRVLRFAKMSAGRAGGRVAAELGLQSGEDVFFMERLRLADADPVILERRCLPARLFPGLSRRDVEGSLYNMIASKYGIQISGADQTIRAVSLSSQDAGFLNVKRGSPGLWVHGVGRQDSPVWVEDTYYRGDLCEFGNRITTSGASRPAQAALNSWRPEEQITGPHRD